MAVLEADGEAAFVGEGETITWRVNAPGAHNVALSLELGLQKVPEPETPFTVITGQVETPATYYGTLSTFTMDFETASAVSKEQSAGTIHSEFLSHSDHIWDGYDFHADRIYAMTPATVPWREDFPIFPVGAHRNQTSVPLMTNDGWTFEARQDPVRSQSGIQSGITWWPASSWQAGGLILSSRPRQAQYEGPLVGWTEFPSPVKMVGPGPYDSIVYNGEADTRITSRVFYLRNQAIVSTLSYGATVQAGSYGEAITLPSNYASSNFYSISGGPGGYWDSMSYYEDGTPAGFNTLFTTVSNRKGIGAPAIIRPGLNGNASTKHFKWISFVEVIPLGSSA